MYISLQQERNAGELYTSNDREIIKLSKVVTAFFTIFLEITSKTLIACTRHWFLIVSINAIR